MARAKRRGLFIVLEGIDGSGTTTQVAQAVDWMRRQGEQVQTTREPSDGPIGTQIRQILSGRLVTRAADGSAQPVDPAAVALLFAADRIDHVRSEIEPALAAGHHVLCDRYVLSSLAYQSVDVDLKFVRAINDKAPAPDLTIFLEVSPEVAMARVSERRPGRDVFETMPFQRRVAESYQRLLESYRDGPVVVLDGEEPVLVVAQKVKAELEKLL